MSSYSTDNDILDISSLFSPQLEGQLRPWVASHMGLQYPGEVIVASRWNDAWGQELAEDRYFRIVLLTSRQRSFTSTLRDARIVVCIPAQDVLRQRRELDRELKSIAEARGLYTVGRQADSSALRSTLEQLNSLPELGPPVGEEISNQVEQLNTSIKMCPASEEDFDLEDRPMCSYCGLRLSESVPFSEVETLLMDVEQSVQEQNSRLSRHGIQQTLAQRDEQVVDKLIKIVRMADLSPLANALSPQVLAFLRTFLASR